MRFITTTASKSNGEAGTMFDVMKAPSDGMRAVTSARSPFSRMLAIP